MNTVFILTGGNIGQRLNNLFSAFESLSQVADTVLLASSSIYETAAWGKEDQPSFYNQVLKAMTHLEPLQMLENMLAIEQQMGRKRQEKNGPRVIDIDLLFYNDLVMNAPQLVLPHPRMAERRFVLAPLAELAPALLHPVLGKTVAELLAACPDPLDVHKLAQQPPWAAAKFAPSL